MSSRLVVVGPPALAALRAEVVAARRCDPMAPLTVVAPGHIPALSVRRALGADPGVVNVAVVTLRRLAEQLGGPALAAAGRRPLRPSRFDEAVRRAVATDPGPFAAVALHLPTIRRLARSLRELRSLGAAEGAAAGSPHLLRLLGAVESAVAPDWDERDLFESAVAVVVSGSVPAPTPVLAFLPRPGSPAATALLVALAGAGRVIALLGVTGDPEADGPTLALHEQLGGTLAGAPSIPPPGPGAVVIAPDADAEARLAVQCVAQRVERPGHPVPLHRMAIVPGGGASTLRVVEHLAAAGIEHSAPSPSTLAASVAGRALLGLMGLPDEGFTRTGLLAVLAGAPIRQHAGGPGSAPAARWGAVAREANVVAGADQWLTRLRLLAAALSGRGRAGRAEEAEQAAVFFSELWDAVDSGWRAGWAELAAWAHGLLDRYLGTPAEGADAGWADAELASHRRVRAVLDDLALLDQTGSSPGRPAFLAAVANGLDVPGPRIGLVGRGVLVARPADLVGADLDLVIVVGLVEGTVPSRRGRDPLLPGHDARARTRAEERAALLMAMAAAPETVAMAARADHQAARRPSRWLLGWAGSLAGRPAGEPLATEELLAGRCEWPWLTVVPSFHHTACATGVAASAQERNLASLDAWVVAGRSVLDHPLAVRNPALAGGLVAVRARRSDAFTAYDGRISRPPALDEAISPTALEQWAECPHRYFLAHVLHVAETEAPEDVLEADGRSRGGLIHEVLEQLVRHRGLGRSPDEPWSDEDRAWAAALAGRLHDDLMAQGRASSSVLGVVRWAELLQRLDQALTLDDRRREEQRLVPTDVEVDFGPGREWGDVVLETPVGRRVGFRGRIDRVDVSEDGSRVAVVDYKTGKQKRVSEAVAGGDPTRLLQLPVYALAARAKWTDRSVDVESAYWLVERDDDQALVANPVSDEQFSAVVDAVVGGIEAGVFPTTPGEDRGHEWANCRYCPYDRVCPADRGHTLRRKHDAVELEPLRALEAVVRPDTGPS